MKAYLIDLRKKFFDVYNEGNISQRQTTQNDFEERSRLSKNCYKYEWPSTSCGKNHFAPAALRLAVNKKSKIFPAESTYRYNYFSN